MGLAIEVGALATYGAAKNTEKIDKFTADLEKINAQLVERGLEPHHEPVAFDSPPETRASLTTFPYFWLHYLRRFAAHIQRDPKWVPYPVQPGEDPAADPVLQQMYRRMESHLLCHSDREGYYLPLDFRELILDPSHEITGGVVGSSYRLRDELLQLCSCLEIEVDDQGELSDDIAAAVADERPNEAPYARERLVWLALWEAARLSIDHRAVILFR